jgi:uncharacterized membrane protein
MLIGGIALTLSYSRVKNLAKKEITKKYLKRGLKIFGYGLLITIFTFLFFREETILFGILHFFGIAIILSIPFLAGKWKNLALGAIIIAIGLQLWQMTFDFPWLMWLGLYPKGMWTFDYFPLLPWFGFILIGIFLGNTLYKDGKRIFKIKELGQKIIAKQLCWAGNHSLIIYFIHQPILVGIILAVKAMGIA